MKWPRKPDVETGDPRRVAAFIYLLTTQWSVPWTAMMAAFVALDREEIHARGGDYGSKYWVTAGKVTPNVYAGREFAAFLEHLEDWLDGHAWQPSFTETDLTLLEVCKRVIGKLPAADDVFTHFRDKRAGLDASRITTRIEERAAKAQNAAARSTELRPGAGERGDADVPPGEGTRDP